MTRRLVWAAVLALPVVGLLVLLARPRLDIEWEHHPAHFWLVLLAALTNVALAVVTSDAARRRADARLFLVSLTFLTSAGFLALHALATPGVLLDEPNAGFVVATPVGLVAAAGFAAASSLDFTPDRSAAFMRSARIVRYAVFAVLAAWAAISLAGVPPLEDPLPAEKAEGWLLAFAVPGIALYALAAARYLALYRRRPARMLLGVVTAFALLAEAMLAVALARNWHASWWEWHLLMLAAFVFVAVTARTEWGDERFADLYVEGRAGTDREVTVLFADLEGFTAFSERRSPEEVATMLNAYFERAVPAVREHGGEVDKLIGDAIMATFNTKGDQREHALAAVRAAVALQRATEPVSRTHPDWLRFRVGVNSGTARVGIVGGEGRREHTTVGEIVNLASRLESKAPPGRVVVGATTYRALPDGARVEPLGGVEVKGKEAPVEAYVVVGLPADGSERGERLQSEDAEREPERRPR